MVQRMLHPSILHTRVLQTGVLLHTRRLQTGVLQSRFALLMGRLGMQVGVKEGVVFLTYSSLTSSSDKGDTRLQQLVDWAGPAFDGLIVFDECHKAKNLVPEAGSKSTKVNPPLCPTPCPQRGQVQLIMSFSWNPPQTVVLPYPSMLVSCLVVLMMVLLASWSYMGCEYVLCCVVVSCDDDDRLPLRP